MLMGCRTWASHTRVVGGKWSLLTIICPTEFSSRRGASVGLLFPWHQPWSLGLQNMAAGLGVPAVLSLPGKMPLWMASLHHPCSLSNGKARQGEPLLLCLSISRGVAPACVTGSGDVGGNQQCQGACPSWPCKVREALLGWQRGMLG